MGSGFRQKANCWLGSKISPDKSAKNHAVLSQYILQFPKDEGRGRNTQMLGAKIFSARGIIEDYRKCPGENPKEVFRTDKVGILHGPHLQIQP